MHMNDQIKPESRLAEQVLRGAYKKLSYFGKRAQGPTLLNAHLSAKFCKIYYKYVAWKGDVEVAATAVGVQVP